MNDTLSRLRRWADQLPRADRVQLPCRSKSREVLSITLCEAQLLDLAPLS